MENAGRCAGGWAQSLRPIPAAAKEMSLTGSGMQSCVLFTFQLGHIQMEDREVLKVFTWSLKEYRIFCLTFQFSSSPFAQLAAQTTFSAPSTHNDNKSYGLMLQRASTKKGDLGL